MTIFLNLDYKIAEVSWRGRPSYVFDTTYNSLPFLLIHKYIDKYPSDLYCILSQKYMPRSGYAFEWRDYEFDYKEVLEEHSSISQYLKFYTEKKKSLMEGGLVY